MPFAAAYVLRAFQSCLPDLAPVCGKAVGKSPPVVEAAIMANDLRPSEWGCPMCHKFLQALCAARLAASNPDKGDHLVTGTVVDCFKSTVLLTCAVCGLKDVDRDSVVKLVRWWCTHRVSLCTLIAHPAGFTFEYLCSIDELIGGSGSTLGL